jgi:hypothetical protein
MFEGRAEEDVTLANKDERIMIWRIASTKLHRLSDWLSEIQRVGQMNVEERNDEQAPPSIRRRFDKWIREEEKNAGRRI